MNKSFSLYLAAQVFITLASSMLSVAVGWHIYIATGNPFDLALVGLMQIFPIAGLFIVSGWVVDNLRRKYILMACAALQGCVLVGLAFSFGEEDISRLAVFGLLFLNGVARAFQMPASQSLLPGLVVAEYLSRAVAISSTVRTAAGTAGPFLAGLLVAWIDTDIYQLLAALTFAASVLYLFLPALAVRRPSGRGLSQLLDGIRYVWRNPLVLPSISLDLLIVLAGSVVALLPVFAADVLKVGPEALGLMRAMPAAGAVAAGLVFTRLGTVRPAGTLLFVSLVLFTASIFVFALSGTLWLSLIALFVYGAADMVSVNIRLTIIQLATPDELRGRVNSVNALFIATSNDLGDFRAGAVATVLSPVATVLLGGLMAAGIVAGGYLRAPALRTLDRLTDAGASADGQDRPRTT